MTGIFIGLLIFFFNDTATTEIYTLSLHDALPISLSTDELTVPALVGYRATVVALAHEGAGTLTVRPRANAQLAADRKSTRLNSSHANISYAVFCLKKKKTNHTRRM